MRYFELCRARDVSPVSNDVEMSGHCVECDIQCVYVVSDEDYRAMMWHNRIPQHLDVSTREFFMSGLCRSCQEEIFKDEDED